MFLIGLKHKEWVLEMDVNESGLGMNLHFQ